MWLFGARSVRRRFYPPDMFVWVFYQPSTVALHGYAARCNVRSQGQGSIQNAVNASNGKQGLGSIHKGMRAR